MKYIGLDVHCKQTHWTLMDQGGEVVSRGYAATTVEGLSDLVTAVGGEDLLAGQEVGAMAYFVHDVLTSLGVQILSFNAHHLRMIASSRKKTDRRDSYWIARSLASGMYPAPVYLPGPRIRRLRSRLRQREAVMRERVRWLLRARGHLRMSGEQGVVRAVEIPRKLESLLDRAEGAPTHLVEVLELCQRQIASLQGEEKQLTEWIVTETQAIPEVQRLCTIPGVGALVAATIYAWVGDVSRFRNARSLCAYAGLVPSVRNSGETNRTGRITKEGPGLLRWMLIQASQSVGNRCRRPEARPLQQIKGRIVRSSGKRKVGTVALARHILRIAFYILRDGTEYQPELLGGSTEELPEVA